ncbi:MAG TPA: ABC transporter permease [Acidimicrobiia bacterium]|nr:ABC transporter permease [Acidimicrobiia bacterium]
MTDSAVEYEIVHQSARRVSLRASLHELAASRECLWSFGERYLRLRYKQAALGVGWAILKPLALFVPFLVFFGGAAGISGGGTTYAAFSLSALVPWQYVAAAVELGSNALVVDGNLMRKIYFPREAPVIGGALSNLPDLAIGVVIVLVVAPLTGAQFGPSLVFLPLLAVLISLPALAVILPLSALAVYYRDVKYGIPLFIQLWLFLSPVAYPITALPPRLRWVMALLNPVSGPLEGFRRVLALGTMPDWGLLGISAASASVGLVFGYWAFKRLERAFADVV